MSAIHVFLRRTALCLLIVTALSAPARPADGPAPASLYQRLGGYDGVTGYVALVFPRVAEHPDLRHLFRGHGKDSQQRYPADVRAEFLDVWRSFHDGVVQK
jgi:hypothetical protein